jgi:hypothetical protein
VVRSGNAQGGAELEPKSKTEPPGLSFDQPNMGAFVFRKRGPYWGGVNRVYGSGSQRLGDAQEGTELGPTSKTEQPGLNFHQQNVQAFIFMQREPYQGGVHPVLGCGGQQLGVVQGRVADNAWCQKAKKTESPGLSFGRQDMGGLCFG